MAEKASHGGGPLTSAAQCAGHGCLQHKSPDRGLARVLKANMCVPSGLLVSPADTAPAGQAGSGHCPCSAMDLSKGSPAAPRQQQQRGRDRDARGRHKQLPAGPPRQAGLRPQQPPPSPVAAFATLLATATSPAGSDVRMPAHSGFVGAYMGCPPHKLLDDNGTHIRPTAAGLF